MLTAGLGSDRSEVHSVPRSPSGQKRSNNPRSGASNMKTATKLKRAAGTTASHRNTFVMASSLTVGKCVPTLHPVAGCSPRAWRCQQTSRQTRILSLWIPWIGPSRLARSPEVGLYRAGCLAPARQPSLRPCGARQSLVTRLISAKLVVPAAAFTNADWRRSRMPARCAASAIWMALPPSSTITEISSFIGITW